jgi:hypothetical protein
LEQQLDILLLSTLIVPVFDFQFHFNIIHKDIYTSSIDSSDLDTITNTTAVLIQGLREERLIQTSFEEEMKFHDALRVETLLVKNASQPVLFAGSITTIKHIILWNVVR